MRLHLMPDSSTSDPTILKTILRAVAERTVRPGQWLSVNQLGPLDCPPQQIDAAIRTLVDRGWLSAAPMTPHSVAITAAGLVHLKAD